MAKDQSKTPVDEKYPLTHKGFGKYEVNGKLLESKDEALAYREELLNAEVLNDEIGDLIPEGFTIHDRVLEFRGDLREVPMNEVYLPDGSINPMYDRMYYYMWAANIGSDISDKRAKGYNLVTIRELQKMIDAGKGPEHYLSLLQREGDYLTYGDSILMRCPRVLWRQRNQEKFDRSVRRIRKTDEQAEAKLRELGSKKVEAPIENELTIRM